MKLTLTIDKSSAEDCPCSCPLHIDENDNICLYFNEQIKILSLGFPPFRKDIACDKCQELYRKQQEQIQ